jgi:hypothetical protein
MRAKQHSGVRRSPVPGKVCFPYVTGHRQLNGKKTWLHKHSKKEFRPKRAGEKLLEFFVAVYRGKVQMKGYHIDPAPPGHAEAYAKKAVSMIKGRGLGDLEMFCVADEFDEWWEGEAKYVKEGGEWIEKKQKGEKHRRARKGWRKAQATIEEKAQLRKQLEKERQREDRRRQQEQIDRAWEKLDKPRAAVTRRPYI